MTNTFQVIHVLPRNRFLHSPSFLGMTYSDDLILLEVAFISGRPKESRLTLLKELNAQIVERAGISPDDLVIQLSEAPGENLFLRSRTRATRIHLRRNRCGRRRANHTSIGKWRRA